MDQDLSIATLAKLRDSLQLHFKQPPSILENTAPLIVPLLGMFILLRMDDSIESLSEGANEEVFKVYLSGMKRVISAIQYRAFSLTPCTESISYLLTAVKLANEFIDGLSTLTLKEKM